MKKTKKKISKSNGQTRRNSSNSSSIQFLEWSPGQWEERRRQEMNWMRKHYGPRGKRAAKEARELSWLAEYMKPSAYPEVGIVFCWKSELLVSSIPWTLNPVAHGFHTYCVGHPTFWKSLQDDGKVPRDVTYDRVPRGRATFNEATGTFTLMADPCIVNDKDVVTAVIRKLNLPLVTAVVADDQYLCEKCLNSRRSAAPNYAYDEEWNY